MLYLHGRESFYRLSHLFITQQLLNVPIYLNITASYFLFVIFLTRLRELCVKLMFLHPVDYGRKAEELLWRKVYYEVIQVIKTNKKVQSHNTFHDLKSSWCCTCNQTEILPLFAAYSQPQCSGVRLQDPSDRWGGLLSTPAALHPVTLSAGVTGLHRLDTRHRPTHRWNMLPYAY